MRTSGASTSMSPGGLDHSIAFGASVIRACGGISPGDAPTFEEWTATFAFLPRTRKRWSRRYFSTTRPAPVATSAKAPGVLFPTLTDRSAAKTGAVAARPRKNISRSRRTPCHVELPIIDSPTSPPSDTSPSFVNPARAPWPASKNARTPRLRTTRTTEANQRLGRQNQERRAVKAQTSNTSHNPTGITPRPNAVRIPSPIWESRYPSPPTAATIASRAARPGHVDSRLTAAWRTPS